MQTFGRTPPSGPGVPRAGRTGILARVMLGSVDVRLYGDLGYFAPEVASEPSVPIGEPRSVKDLLESLGVPHPEIGLILVNGSAVGFERLVQRGDRVAAYPPFRSLPVDSPLDTPRPEPRFVLDVHLGTLARRLRLLGLDCDYGTDRADVELAQIATGEERILLTRDRGLLMRKEIQHGYCPRSDDPAEQTLEVAVRYLRPDDLRPFSRCTRCNGLLADVDKAAVLDQLEPHTRATQHAFRRCQRCGKAYWPGSHLPSLEELVDRVRAVLDRNTT